MNDFLRNLRSSNKKDAALPKKNTEGNYYRPTDRRTPMDRRTAAIFAKGDNFPQQLGDALPEILENTTTLTEQFEKLTTSNNLLAEAKIKQHNAVTDFFNSLTRLISEEKGDPFSQTDPQKVTASYASGTHYTKDDIMSIIQEMRNEGATFAIIADYLKEKGMPTFSGRGEWHAQTIHRLCK
jgi:hypothetical protein